MRRSVFMEEWVLKASWTLKQAALLVNEHDPESEDLTIDLTGSKPIDRTYTTLLHAYKAGDLISVGEENGEPLFKACAIIDFLKRTKRPVSKTLVAAYENRGNLPTARRRSLETKQIYKQAARLARRDNPFLSKNEIAQQLTALPKYIGDNKLERRGAGTIRDYLKDFDEGKAGRPKKSNQDNTIDLVKIAQNLCRESG